MALKNVFANSFALTSRLSHLPSAAARAGQGLRAHPGPEGSSPWPWPGHQRLCPLGPCWHLCPQLSFVLAGNEKGEEVGSEALQGCTACQPSLSPSLSLGMCACPASRQFGNPALQVLSILPGLWKCEQAGISPQASLSQGSGTPLCPKGGRAGPPEPLWAAGPLLKGFLHRPASAQAFLSRLAPPLLSGSIFTSIACS